MTVTKPEVSQAQHRADVIMFICYHEQRPKLHCGQGYQKGNDVSKGNIDCCCLAKTNHPLGPRRDTGSLRPSVAQPEFIWAHFSPGCRIRLISEAITSCNRSER